MEDSTELFMREVANFPLLNTEETSRLIELAKTGDNDALNQVVNSNLRLVVSRTKRFMKKGVEFMDLVQEGSLGLQHAIEKFDTTKGNMFSTYAAPWIDKYMGNYIIKTGRTITIPAHIQEKASKICKAKDAFCLENGREPSSEELASCLSDISKDDIEEINLLYYQTNVDSLDRNIFEDTPLYEVVGNNEDNYDDYDSQKDIKAKLNDVLSCLDERAKYIITHTYGVFDNDEESFEEIGEHFGISAERVRQIKKSAMAFLKENYADSNGDFQ